MEGFCTHCGFQIEKFEGLRECPKCGTTGVPCKHEDQVEVSINLHELRILCIWAENWGQEINGPDVVYSIANRLKKQLPEKTSLTLADEFIGLKDQGIDFKTNHPSGDLP